MTENIMITPEMLKLDSQNMFDILKNFPGQVKQAIEIGKSAPSFKDKPESDDFLILGMGGSAIGGDLLKTFFSSLPGGRNFNITVNRNYTLPFNISNKTNVIACSYSGNTEETISALAEAARYTERIVCITSGGELANVAEKNNYPVIKIPGGMQPRCALGYSFFPLLYLFMHTGLLNVSTLSEIENSIDELLLNLENKSKIFSQLITENNPSLKLAFQLKDTAVVIYSSCDKLDSTNLRWRCQLQENAKNLAFGNLLPEMNHNEINAFSFPSQMSNNISMVFLTDKTDHERTKIRFGTLKEILENSVDKVLSLSGEGEHSLARMFDLIYLGDWASYYLALINGVDPTPIPLISTLKNRLWGKA